MLSNSFSNNSIAGFLSLIHKVVVPKGTTIYEGIATPQNIYDSIENVIGTLPGGGSQIYSPKVEVGWFQ